MLPLAALSHEPVDADLADGLTDGLITEPARLQALTVISRTSVMRYRTARQPLREIARDLNVKAIVEGTVQRSGGQVRIAARLIDAAADNLPG